MKINPEISSVINMVKKDEGYQKKNQESQEHQQKVADIISVENTAASRSNVESVEDARSLLNNVMEEMENHSTEVHDLNQYRISMLIS